MRYGLDLLAANKYGRTALAELPNSWAFGIFWDVSGFGNAGKLIDTVARSRKPGAIRVHLMWKDQHDFSSRDFPEIVKRAKALHAISSKYPGIAWYVSPACENKLSAADAKTICDQTAAACPSCQVVNSTMSGVVIPGVITEVHGAAPKKPTGPYIVSYDGAACVDSDVEKWKRAYSDAQICFLWDSRFNGRWETNDNTPREKRRGWPDSKHIRSVVYLGTPKGETKDLPRNDLYKSHAENKGKPDKRAEKPVTIVADRTSSISFVSLNGKAIAKARYYGTYTGGGYRYYCEYWGYELAKKAKDVSGSPLVFLVSKGKKYGPLNNGFREGLYRSSRMPGDEEGFPDTDGTGLYQ